MEKCVFCKQINDGSLSSRTIYEDKEFIAFLDAANLTKGHTLVIPREHVKYVWGYRDQEGYFKIVSLTAKHLMKALNIDTVHTLISGTSVPHAHVHLLPNTSGIWFKVIDYLRSERKKMSQEQIKIDPDFVKKLKFKEKLNGF